LFGQEILTEALLVESQVSAQAASSETVPTTRQDKVTSRPVCERHRTARSQFDGLVQPVPDAAGTYNSARFAVEMEAGKA
jgi:hypothetical protein